MKLTRNVVAPALVLGLFVGLAGGCGTKKPPGTNPPGEDGGGDGGAVASGDGGSGGASDGGTKTDGGGDGGAAGDGGATPANCGAQVADTPTLLFGDKVILRPPPGVEFAVDDNPTFAQATMGGGFISTCDANIKRVMINVSQADKKKSPAKVIPEWIKALEGAGYTGGKVIATHLDTPTDAHVSVEYPGAGGQEAIVLYIADARRDDTDFIIIFESGPEDHELLKPTYMESAKSLFIVPE